jgi:N-acyl-D-aspartate/D-glutamate deacylase
MEYDLLIRGGRVVDGSGLPGFMADVGIKDGKVVELGRLRGSAARTIDADGLVVAPGFIDHHTHMDAQLFWDPYATSEPQCGITSIVMGNCGLTLAPVKDEDGQDGLVKSLCRVEAIPREALGAGVPWGWRSYGDYLDTLERRGLGVNVGGMVGHIAVRQYVMGEESVEREATPAEIAQMQTLVREGMEGGALGLSTNRNERHMREDGKPVPSRLATDDEFFALCDVLSELNAGIIQTILGLNKPQHAAWYREVAKRTGRTVTWQSVLHRWSEPDLWRQQLEAIAPNFRDGYRTFGLTMTVPLVRLFSLKNAQVFDEFPTWKNLMFLPELVRRQAFADPETRQKLREDLATPRITTFHKRWDIVRVHRVAKPEHKRYEGKSIEELGRMRGQDPLDAFLDLSLAEELETVFWNTNSGGDPVAMGEILRSPYVLVGTSDAGAHVQYGADFGYGVTLLGLWVRERGELSLEQAVHKLTFHVASVYELQGRGLLRPGYAADVVVFDPDTVAAHEAEWVQDYPAGTRRLIQRADGVHYTIVNGTVIQEEGRIIGELPGQVLRGAAYRARTAALA